MATRLFLKTATSHTLPPYFRNVHAEGTVHPLIHYYKLHNRIAKNEEKAGKILLNIKNA